jgi:hypothetical protein
MPLEGEIDKNTQNTETVIGIENNSRNSIEPSMAWLISWISATKMGQIQSFQRIICDLLGRNCQKSRDKTYLSRVDIE